jgi:hypothetical protein
MLALAPAASAQVTAQLNPNTAGAGSHLALDAKGSDAGFRDRTIPSGLAIGLQKGFVIDPAAAAGVCSDAQSAKFTCPANSILGTGSLDVFGEGLPFGPHGSSFTAQLTFYRATPRQPSDPMGVVFSFREPTSGFQGASIGRVDTVSDPSLGEEIRFDKLPIPALPSGLHFTLRELKIDLGAGAATPPVRVKKKTTKHRVRRHRGRFATRVSSGFVGTPPGSLALEPGGPAGPALLTNPTACSGNWLVRFELDYPDGPQTHDAQAPCVP